MVKIPRPYDAAQAALDAYVHEKAMRPSRVRNMVLEAACALPQPFTAAKLVEACKAERISVGTVYNTLNLLILARVVHAIERQRGRAATEYEVTATAQQVHIQMICTRCGREVELHDKAITRLVQERKYSNFNMRSFSLFVYGECKLCRRKVLKER